jgi:hypothetical protein
MRFLNPTIELTDRHQLIIGRYLGIYMTFLLVCWCINLNYELALGLLVIFLIFNFIIFILLIVHDLGRDSNPSWVSPSQALLFCIPPATVQIVILFSLIISNWPYFSQILFPIVLLAFLIPLYLAFVYACFRNLVAR